MGEKRRGSAGYKSYLNREGPRSLGSREEPKVGRSVVFCVLFFFLGGGDVIQHFFLSVYRSLGMGKPILNTP